ncbi:hypothetical protein FSP39_011419, partial [Pinctada imbricata]
VDALKIDWSSLMQTSQPIPKVEGSALKRFRPGAVLAKLGVSKTLAGSSLFQKLQETCESETQEESEKESKEEGYSLQDHMSLVQSNATTRLASQRSILQNIGTFRRGLCARKDLEIRRQLCKLDKNMVQPHAFAAPVVDKELCKLSIQLFKRSQAASKSATNQNQSSDYVTAQNIKQEVACT